MTETKLLQRLTMFVFFASIIFASPLDYIVRNSEPSEIASVDNAVEGGSATDVAINGLTTTRSFDSPTLESVNYKFEPDTVEDEKPPFDLEQIGGRSSLNENGLFTSSGQGHNTEHKESIEIDARTPGDLETADNNLNNAVTGQEISRRNATEAMGYHNYAMVCAESKMHTDYCANRRRGYYCSQNGFLQIHSDGNRYAPCEEKCICADIGVKPVCQQVWAIVGAKGSTPKC